MDDFAQVLRHCLMRLADDRRTATYHDLATMTAIPPPHRIHRLTLMLEDLIREDHSAGRPLLAACAVSRAQKGLPGLGFFQLLQDLGRYDGARSGPQAAACHRCELEAAWDYWGRVARGEEGADRDN